MLKEIEAMDELVQLVSEKTGLSEELSRQAVEVVLEFLKEKLPPPIADRLDDLLEGGDLTDLGNLAQGLGGLFGGN
jgi:uncharacterized protein (DUF2267 family)